MLKYLSKNLKLDRFLSLLFGNFRKLFSNTSRISLFHPPKPNIILFFFLFPLFHVSCCYYSFCLELFSYYCMSLSIGNSFVKTTFYALCQPQWPNIALHPYLYKLSRIEIDHQILCIQFTAACHTCLTRNVACISRVLPII